jgi:hypothetical protein
MKKGITIFLPYSGLPHTVKTIEELNKTGTAENVILLSTEKNMTEIKGK